MRADDGAPDAQEAGAAGMKVPVTMYTTAVCGY